MLQKVVSFVKAHAVKIAIGIAVLVALIVIVASYMGDSLTSYGKKDDSALLPAGASEHEAPVGGMAAKLGLPSAWFSSSRFTHEQDPVIAPIAADTDTKLHDIMLDADAIPEKSHELLPEDAADTGDLLASGLALKPQMSSWRAKTHSRDLTTRGDISNPIGTGPAPDATLHAEPHAASPYEHQMSMW